MFEVQIGDTKVGVKFGYFSHKAMGELSKRIKYTNCTVSSLSSPRPVARGRARCSASDQFNKNIGRKISLARAIQPASRPVRKVIWKAYFKAHGRVD